MSNQIEDKNEDVAPRPIPLYVDDLLDAARQQTGLSDFGDADFIEGLEALTKSLRDEASLHEGGKIFESHGIVRMLSNHLRYQRDIKDHPEILEEKIESPIIVVGLPRTGTSKLQRVISADPDSQRLEVWRLFNPAPVPNEELGNPVERIEIAKAIEEMFRTQYPGWMARHPMEAREPDEELFIMEMSFECVVSSMLARTPTFRKFATSCDPRPTYKLLFNMLQYLQWQDGGARGRPWVMKSPVHVGYLDILFEFFPDATVVHCHRDPAKIVPSFASVILEGRRMTTDKLDPVEIGQEWFEYWASLTDRYLQIRDDLPHSRILNVDFKDICNDPISVVSNVYKKAGRKLSPQAVESCKQYDERRPEKHWGAYDYTLEEFGLDKEKIRNRFESYLQAVRK